MKKIRIFRAIKRFLFVVRNWYRYSIGIKQRRSLIMVSDNVSWSKWKRLIMVIRGMKTNESKEVSINNDSNKFKSRDVVTSTGCNMKVNLGLCNHIRMDQSSNAFWFSSWRASIPFSWGKYDVCLAVSYMK